MGVSACDGCEKCNTTLAESPSTHRPIAPHTWQERWTIDEKTGVRGKERVCLACMKVEAVPESAT